MRNEQSPAGLSIENQNFKQFDGLLCPSLHHNYRNVIASFPTKNSQTLNFEIALFGNVVEMGE